jgi:hypothetical protein
MAAPSADAPPKVPRRNDQKTSPLYRNSQATKLRGEDPDFVYQTFDQRPESPAYIGNRTVPHQAAPRSAVWNADVGPWEVCHSQTDKEVRALDPRTDQGKPIDTVQRYGNQIRCRIHKDEFAKYAQVEKANQAEREKQLYSPDQLKGQQASMTALVMDGDQDETARMQALINAGHPIPGAGRVST